ncbi:uncharacterized protein [Spinacia oleracea]|uniref:Uncharacterized protein isoform X2 n=1 Tax=Spinacia oleracea TaxID=3562 RepID=A0ABM3R336_SPIOL|nr:uncharacterized protein LOC110775896 isoform X2 [Spinacia oleracea]
MRHPLAAPPLSTARTSRRCFPVRSAPFFLPLVLSISFSSSLLPAQVSHHHHQRTPPPLRHPPHRAISRRPPCCCASLPAGQHFSPSFFCFLKKLIHRKMWMRLETCGSSICSSKKRMKKTKLMDSDPPPRITTNVQQNLQFLKLWKEFQKSKSCTPKPATSYRRKKVEKEDLPPDAELYKDPTLSLYYTSQVVDSAVPVLLVDGYNVCGYWVKLKKYFMGGRLDVARQKLVDELVQFSLVREVKVVAVFDAMLSGLPTHKETFAGVDIVFSGDSCADSWIEKEVVALREDGCPKVWVVTSDHAQQHAAHGAGAFVWSSKALVTEQVGQTGTWRLARNARTSACQTDSIDLDKKIKIKASKKEMEKMLQEQRSTSMQGKLLKHNLDIEVVDALKDLKMKLSQNG